MEIFYVTSADLNDDGILDLLVGVFSASASNGLSVFYGLPNGGLSAGGAYQALGFVPPAVGDLNGDGWPDLVTSGDSSDVLVFLNDGTGHLVAGGSYPTTHQPQIPRLGDLNGDGLLDLVIGENNYPDLPIEILFGDGDGGFGFPQALPAANATLFGGVLVGDVNHDGLVDVIADSADQSELVLFLNQNDGGFLPEPYPFPAAPQLAWLPRPIGGPDVVVGVSSADDWGLGDGGLQVLRNDGSGNFVGGQVAAVPALFLAVSDLNADGLPDIGATRWAQCGTEVVADVVYGLADGGFSDPVAIPSGQGPGGIVPFGNVSSPHAFAIGDACGGGITIYGDASR